MWHALSMALNQSALPVPSRGDFCAGRAHSIVIRSDIIRPRSRVSAWLCSGCGLWTPDAHNQKSEKSMPIGRTDDDGPPVEDPALWNMIVSVSAFLGCSSENNGFGSQFLGGSDGKGGCGGPDSSAAVDGCSWASESTPTGKAKRVLEVMFALLRLGIIAAFCIEGAPSVAAGAAVGESALAATGGIGAVTKMACASLYEWLATEGGDGAGGDAVAEPVAFEGGAPECAQLEALDEDLWNRGCAAV